MGLEFVGMAVLDPTTFDKFRLFDFAGGDREFALNEQHKLTPRFVRVAELEALRKGWVFFGELGEQGLKCWRKILKVA